MRKVGEILGDLYTRGKVFKKSQLSNDIIQELVEAGFEYEDSYRGLKRYAYNHNNILNIAINVTTGGYDNEECRISVHRILEGTCFCTTREAEAFRTTIVVYKDTFKESMKRVEDAISKILISVSKEWGVEL